MAKKEPWFQFYPNPWLRDWRLQRMPLASQGAYVRLLCYQWLEGAVPFEDPIAMGFIVGCPPKEWSQTHKKWLGYHFTPCSGPEDGEEGWGVNLPLKEMSEKAKAALDKQREAGAEGARRRWKNLQEERAAEAQRTAEEEKAREIAAHEASVSHGTPEEQSYPAKPRPKPVKRLPERNQNIALQNFWLDEWERTRNGDRFRITTKHAVGLADILNKACLGNIDEAKRRVTAHLEDKDHVVFKSASPIFLISQWNRYPNMEAPKPNEAKLSTPKEVPEPEDMETLAKRQLAREFKDPKFWTPEEKADRKEVVIAYLKERMPRVKEEDLRGHMTPGRVLEALQKDSARNPGKYGE